MGPGPRRDGGRAMWLECRDWARPEMVLGVGLWMGLVLEVGIGVWLGVWLRPVLGMVLGIGMRLWNPP